MLALYVSAAPAADLRLDIGTIDGAGWQASGLRLSLRVEAGEPLVWLDLPALRLAGVELSVTAAARCVAEDATLSRLRCDTMTVDATPASGASLRLRGAAVVQRDADGLRVDIEPIDFAGGHGKFAFAARGESLTLGLSLTGVEARALELLAGLLPFPEPVVVSAGRLDLSAEVAVEAGVLRSADARVELRELAFSDTDGLRVGEGLSADLRLGLSPAGKGRRLAVEASVSVGQAYVQPWFVDFAQTPLRLNVEGAAPHADGEIEVSRLDIEQVGVVRVGGSGRVSSDLELLAVELAVARTPVAALAGSWLQPLLPPEFADGLEATGEISAGLVWHGEDDLGLRLDLHGVALGDALARFSLHGLEGRLQWHTREPRVVLLEVDAADVYRLQFGPMRLIGEVAGRRFTLQQPLRVPLFGGALRVDSLQAQDIGTPSFNVALAGELEPLDLETLSAAMGWPGFGGTLAGSLPDLRYVDGVLVLGSALVTHVFDGQVVVEDLRLEDPFGVVPVLQADVRIENLSLADLTRAFAFGAVSGRLDGNIRGLMLRDWQPRAFEARFATPADDRSEHRISQRAVNNLASIGGAGGVLSAGFLRIFSEFSYDRLGLSCVLRNGVCEMGGVEEAEGGYYIVIGGGLPRIDVVGFNRQVNWAVLLERLVQATRSQGPVVQ